MNTSPPQASGVADDTAKVNVVAGTFKEKPRTLTSEANRSSGDNSQKLHTFASQANGSPNESYTNIHNIGPKANEFSGEDDEEDNHTFAPEANGFSHEDKEKSLTSGSRSKNRRLREAKAEGAYLWETMVHCLLRPKMLGGCVGLGKVLFTLLYSVFVTKEK